ncbi:hypothetical protein [Caulobacter sp. NIBR2454]|uniref:hypothetical protein n=1 Tax=Caulobacter sp. NIBR2454 TaxID=3015996 RepID=UPI0022B68BD5|nr:hypothetical protein [Caulobacter sp. NIBR2454]
MLIAILLAAAAAAQPVYQPAENNRPVPACVAGQLIPAVTKPTDNGQRASRLGDLPTAAMELAVGRRVDGCPAPMIVRNNVEQNIRSGR